MKSLGKKRHVFYFPLGTAGLNILKKKLGFERVKIDGNYL